jgi:hypothetical protein
VVVVVLLVVTGGTEDGIWCFCFLGVVLRKDQKSGVFLSFRGRVSVVIGGKLEAAEEEVIR